MQESRIEQKIEDIYGFVESCKMQSFSSTKVIVPKNDLYDLLDDLRRDAPERDQALSQDAKPEGCYFRGCRKRRQQIS